MSKPEQVPSVDTPSHDFIYHPRPLSPNKKPQYPLTNEGHFYIGEDNLSTSLDELEKKPAGCCDCFTRRFPWLARVVQGAWAVMLSAPSAIIASAHGTPTQPGALGASTSLVANTFLNSVFDLSSVIKNTREAYLWLKTQNVVWRLLIFSSAFVGVFVCGFSNGALTYESYPWNHVFHEYARSGFFILAVLGTSIQRSIGTTALVVRLTTGKFEFKKLDLLDGLISLLHFGVGIGIWLDMYTPKSYKGLHRLAALFGKDDFICDDKDCRVSPPVFGVFAYFSLMHLIFFCWAARRPLQTILDFYNFFVDSKYAQDLSPAQKKFFKSGVILLILMLGAISYYSAHGLVGADKDGRFADPAGINKLLFNFSLDTIERFGDFFFTVVNLLPMYLKIPEVLKKLSLFLPSQDNEDINLDNLTYTSAGKKYSLLPNDAHRESKKSPLNIDESKEIKRPLLGGGINSSYSSASAPQSNNVNGLFPRNSGKSSKRTPLLQSDTTLEIS